jgi:pimeloyl-ACP methyl ester carboxylesterase
MIRHATFRNIKVRFTDKGKGRAIVLLHGFPESLEIWEEFSEALSKYFRVIAIDLPGFGETPVTGYTHTMDLMAECVKAVMDSIGYRKYAIAGHSMGGYVALAFADLFPENTSGICLFHSSALPDSEEKKKDRVRATEIVKKDHRHYVSELINKLFAPSNIPDFEDRIVELKESAYNTPTQGIINALLGMKDRPDRQHVLKNAAYPVQFIIGKDDQVMPEHVLLEQTKLSPRISALVLENCGHMGFYEAREKTLKAVLKWARKCFRNEKVQ